MFFPESASMKNKKLASWLNATKVDVLIIILALHCAYQAWKHACIYLMSTFLKDTSDWLQIVVCVIIGIFIYVTNAFGWMQISEWVNKILS